MQMVQEFPGRPGTIGADQDLLTEEVSVLIIEIFRQLSPCMGEYLDMRGDGVRAPVFWAQLHCEDFVDTGKAS